MQNNIKQICGTGSGQGETVLKMATLSCYCAQYNDNEGETEKKRLILLNA